MIRRRTTIAALTFAVLITGSAGITGADARASVTEDFAGIVQTLFARFRGLIGLAPEEQRQKLTIMEADFAGTAAEAGWQKVEGTAAPVDTRHAERPSGSPAGTANPLACDSLNFEGELDGNYDWLRGGFELHSNRFHPSDPGADRFVIQGRVGFPFIPKPDNEFYYPRIIESSDRDGSRLKSPVLESSGRATGRMDITTTNATGGEDRGTIEVIVQEETFHTVQSIAGAAGRMGIIEERATFPFEWKNGTGQFRERIGKKGVATFFATYRPWRAGLSLDPADRFIKQEYALTLRGDVPPYCPPSTATPLPPMRASETPPQGTAATQPTNAPVYREGTSAEPTTITSSPGVEDRGSLSTKTPNVTILPPLLPAEAPTAPWAERSLVKCEIWYCMVHWWQGGGFYASDMVTALDQTSKIRMSNGADSAQYIRGGPYTTLKKAQESANTNVQCGLPADPVDPACATTQRLSPPGPPVDEPLASAVSPDACTATGQGRSILHGSIFLSDDGDVVAYTAQGYGTEMHSYPPITYYVNLRSNTVRRLDRRYVGGMSPDGGKLILSDGHRATVYDIATGTAEQLPGDGTADFSPDGRYALYGVRTGNTLTSPVCMHLYDLQTRESREIRCGMSANFRGDGSIVLSYAQATNGGHTISSDNVHFYLYDQRTGDMSPISSEESAAFDRWRQSRDGRRTVVLKGSNFGRGPFTAPDLQRLYLKERTASSQNIRVLFEQFTQPGTNGRPMTYAPVTAKISRDGNRVVAVIGGGEGGIAGALDGGSRHQILVFDIPTNTWTVVNPQAGDACAFPLPGTPQSYTPPRDGHFVVDGNVDIFSDAQCSERRNDVRGLLLVEKSGGTESSRLVATTKREDYYLPGMHVAWLWDTSRGWKESWYRHPVTQQCEYAWRESGEFTGFDLP